MRVLAVGIATLDIINEVAEYPVEDAEVRAVAQRSGRGGNATNTLVVLAQLGHTCDWAGVLTDEFGAGVVRDDLARFGIGVRHVVREPRGRLPTSSIVLSAAKGSRTIVHYRELPEYSLDKFRTIDLCDYDWVHFEGRNVPVLANMLADVRRAGGPRCSVEIEKPRSGIEPLFGMADLLLFSRHYALARGYSSAAALLGEVAAPGQSTVCAWGEAGAWGRDARGSVHHSPAFSPAPVVETLGAGDAFNAAMIDAWSAGQDMPLCLDAATRLAGHKCAQRGFDGLSPE